MFCAIIKLQENKKAGAIEMIREAYASDLQAFLELYTHLHEKEVPPVTEELLQIWHGMIQDKNHHIIVCELDSMIIASCICVVVPNLTRSVRPYALIENVVTHADYRKQGHASACLAYAKEIAAQENCYKMMLLTGAKDDATLRFYRSAGYNCTDKTAFVQWL